MSKEKANRRRLGEYLTPKEIFYEWIFPMICDELKKGIKEDGDESKM